MPDLCRRPGERIMLGDQQGDVLTLGQRLTPRPDDDLRATQADLNGEPAVFRLSGLLHVEGRRQALYLLKLIEGALVAGGLTGHDWQALRRAEARAVSRLGPVPPPR
jgi:hypothetical protein